MNRKHMIIYNFLFYKFYSFSKLIGNIGVSNKANAWFSTTLFLYLNLISIKFLIEIIAKKIIFYYLTDLILPVFIGFFVYYNSVRNDSFLTYENLFAHKNKSLVGSILILCYCIISTAAFFYLDNLHHTIR